jgi:hypothetical protein
MGAFLFLSVNFVSSSRQVAAFLCDSAQSAPRSSSFVRCSSCQSPGFAGLVVVAAVTAPVSFHPVVWSWTEKWASFSLVPGLLRHLSSANGASRCGTMPSSRWNMEWRFAAHSILWAVAGMIRLCRSNWRTPSIPYSLSPYILATLGETYPARNRSAVDFRKTAFA